MKQRITALSLATVSLALLVPACVATPTDGAVDEDPNTSLASPINGTLTFGSECTYTMQTNIRTAMLQIMGGLAGGDLLECMQHAVLASNNGDLPEQIVQKLKQNMPTHVECKDQVCDDPTADGCAAIGISSEKIALRKDVLTQPTAAIAGLMASLIAHNKGYRSELPAERDFSVASQVKSCVAVGAPNGLGRNELVGESELAKIGGEGGSPFELSCASGQWVRGMRVRSSSRVNELQLTCTSNSTGAVGTVNDSTRMIYGGCPTGEVVVGIFGRSQAMVDELGIRCAKQSALESGALAPVTSNVWLGGGSGGLAFERNCPAGMAVKRVYGRAGSRIDQMRVVCQNVNAVERGQNHDLLLLGTAVGGHVRQSCFGFGAMTSLHGRAGGEVDALGGMCRTTTRAPNGLPAIGALANQHIVAFEGGNGGSLFNDSCPSGTALVGLRVRPTPRVGSVRGVCANPSEWSTPLISAPTRFYTPTRGGAPQLEYLRECPRGEYIVGFDTYTATSGHETPTVQGTIPICRRL